jgi:hypothetical protein
MTPSMIEYVNVYKEYLNDNDPGKYKRITDLWDEMSCDEKIDLTRYCHENKIVDQRI